MAELKDLPMEAAKTFFEAILKQSELLGSWSLAVFGSCVVLVAWYVQRRLDKKGQPMMRALPLVFACAILQGLSILLMYMAYGRLVNIIPIVQFEKFETAKQFFDTIDGANFDQARYLFVAQFVTFFGGIVLIGIFAVLNYHLVRGAP